MVVWRLSYSVDDAGPVLVGKPDEVSFLGVPLLGQIAGLVLVLYHQSYRYIAAVQILTLALVFCSLLPFSHDVEVSIGGTLPSTDVSGPSCGDLG